MNLWELTTQLSFRFMDENWNRIEVVGVVLLPLILSVFLSSFLFSSFFFLSHGFQIFLGVFWCFYALIYYLYTLHKVYTSVY